MLGHSRRTPQWFALVAAGILDFATAIVVLDIAVVAGIPLAHSFVLVDFVIDLDSHPLPHPHFPKGSSSLVVAVVLAAIALGSIDSRMFGHILQLALACQSWKLSQFDHFTKSIANDVLRNIHAGLA